MKTIMIGQLLLLCVEETVREEAVWVVVCPFSGSLVPPAVHETCLPLFGAFCGPLLQFSVVGPCGGSL